MLSDQSASTVPPSLLLMWLAAQVILAYIRDFRKEWVGHHKRMTSPHLDPGGSSVGGRALCAPRRYPYSWILADGWLTFLSSLPWPHGKCCYPENELSNCHVLCAFISHNIMRCRYSYSLSMDGGNWGTKKVTQGKIASFRTRIMSLALTPKSIPFPFYCN